MPFTLAATCPLRGLSFANAAPLALHLRDDHRLGRGRPASPNGPPGVYDPAGERAGDRADAGSPARPAPRVQTLLAVFGIAKGAENSR